MPEYTVEPGDTLGKIAAANNTTVSELMALNSDLIKDKDLIRIGWTLQLPGEGEGTTDPEAEPTDDTEVGFSLLNVPGTPKVWHRTDGRVYLVYQVPDTEDDPILMAWHVPSPGDLQSMFGPDQEIKYNRENVTDAEWQRHGVLEFGTTDEIPAGEHDPFATWTSTMEANAITQPWILEDDYQALIGMAAVEGRALTEAELATTDWWRTHNKDQREWMTLVHGDPQEADRVLADYELQVSGMLTGAGAGPEPPPELVSHMARARATGEWSDAYLSSQIRAVTDPYSTFETDESLMPMLEENPITQTQAEEDRVRDLLHQWLGPAFGAWDEAEIAREAGMIRNDPEHEQRLIEQLKDQRMAVLPQYEDREISYQAIANTWKQWWYGQWGQSPDENSDLWLTVLQNNDATESARLLRREGYERGVPKVVQDLSNQTIRSLGGSVRRGVYA